MGKEEEEAVTAVLRSSYLTTGPVLREFEEKFQNFRLASFCGVKYAVAVSNGTAALHAAVAAAGLAPGDEAIVPAVTFAATANAVIYQGAKPILADISPGRWQSGLPELQARYKEGLTKAVLPVDFTGLPVQLDPIMAWAEETGLTVILDAAHSFGGKYNGKPVGATAHMTIFSFHPVKNMTTGEGGAVVTNNEALYRKLLLFRTHGITRNKELLESKDEGPWYYEMQMLGYNYRLSDIHAAIGLAQLAKMPSFAGTRRRLTAYYNHALSKVATTELLFIGTMS